MKKISAAIILLSIFIYLASQSNIKVSAQTNSVTPTVVNLTPTATATALPDNEVVVLRAQLEIMQQYNQQILATVYWALGIIAGLAVLLVGFGWFVNFRVYERDKSTMQDDLRYFIRSELETSSKAFEKRIDEKIEKSVKDYQENLKASLVKMQARVSSIEEALAESEYKRLSEETKKETYKDSAFRQYVRMIELAHKLPPYLDFYFSEPLENIITLLKDGLAPAPEDVKDLNKELNNVPEGYAMDVESIRQLIKNSRILKT
ncbi:MAG: hypothetical protein LC108_00025 [Anaerolineales bacterium]|nr:hypothetical protein [Anaerolineales bacterium]